MKSNTIFCAALLGALAAPAFADGFRFVGGEAGWAHVGVKTDSTTRDQFARERAELDRNQVTAYGFRFVGGEAGWSYEVAPVRTQQHNLAASPPSAKQR